MTASDRPTAAGGAHITRRGLLRGMAALAAAGSLPLTLPVHAHGIGIVNPPLPLPPGATLLRHDGARLALQDMFAGRLTALQLMFTGCSQTCPLQGALFAEVQAGLARLPSKDVRLLSLSIDPFDDNKRLTAWLKRFGAADRWAAAVPLPQHLDMITSALRQRGNPKDNHATQVYFIDRKAQLIWRSEELPPPQVVLGILEKIGAA